MRKILILFLLLNVTCFAQTHVEYISEKCDSMALINQSDIDVINNVFAERNKLDSLNTINKKIISGLELGMQIQDSVIEYQDLAISNNENQLNQLEYRNQQTIEKYSKELKQEKRKTASFQSLTGISLIAIILLILL